jgi:hypothetical protein
MLFSVSGNLVCHPKQRIGIEDVSEQSVEGSIWICGRGSNTRMERIV